MNIGVYRSASAMVGLDRWQEAISQNIAAAQVPGYRRNEHAFESKKVDIARYGGAGRDARAAEGVVPNALPQLSFQLGEIRTTGNDTDFAIQGRGFFQVQIGPERSGYTRDGEFHVNAQRQLVNKAGLPVLGENGPITLRPEGGQLSISSDGSLVQGETAIGRLGVFDFADPAKIQRIGNGLLGSEDPNVQPARVQNAEVVSGVLEMSNVQPLQEMVNMITVARAYEANQKLVMNQDELMGKAIQTLGSLSA